MPAVSSARAARSAIVSRPLRQTIALAGVHDPFDHTRFSHVSAPPRERGRTWSRLPSSGFSNLPAYWEGLPSRSRIVFAQSCGRFFGTFAKLTVTMTVGTRIARRTACVALSCGRTGNVIHSSHVDGTNVVFVVNVQCRGHLGGHHAKRLLRRA